jgi:hypothetical protein
MANEFGNISTGDQSRREDLLDVITNISPIDTPFTSGLKIASDAKNTLHEWLTDTLDSRGSNKWIEGHGATIALLTNPSRETNVTQIIRKDGGVSETQRAIDHAGFADRLAYAAMLKTKAWKNDLEYNVILSTLDTGASGVARAMTGAIAFITSIATGLSSMTLSETIYNSITEIAWGYGGNIDEVYVGGWLKRKISGFTAGSTKNVDSSDKRLTNSIDVYENDFGVHKIFLCRDLNSTGASCASMMMIDSQHWALAYLRKPKYKEVASDGSDIAKFNIIGEVTLECKAQNANAVVSGIANNL